MHILVKGSIFVGYAGKIVCEHCKNISNPEIRQVYHQSTVLFVKLPRKYFQVYRMCRVCEKKKRMIGIKWLASKDEWNRLHRDLNAGRELTKAWVHKLGVKDQNEVLKRLNALKAYDLVAYLCQ